MTPAGARRLFIVAIETYHRILIPHGKMRNWHFLCGTKGCCNPWHPIPNRPYAVASGDPARATRLQVRAVRKHLMHHPEPGIGVAYDPRIACLPAERCQHLSEVLGVPREAIWAGWAEVCKEDLRCQMHGVRARGAHHSDWVSRVSPERRLAPPPAAESLGWYATAGPDGTLVSGGAHPAVKVR